MFITNVFTDSILRFNQYKIINDAKKRFFFHLYAKNILLVFFMVCLS